MGDVSRMEKSFLLMDTYENLKDSSKESFCKRLGSLEHEEFKMVSIFGETGEGKTYTLNRTFFDGEEVFKSSNEKCSSTTETGVFAALQKTMGLMCIDTKGQMNISNANYSHHQRMLLKILAVSDIVIYRTRYEGRDLKDEMYKFLGTASKAFVLYFSQALDLPRKKGPALIIFHETEYTTPLKNTINKTVEDRIRERFAGFELDTEAFSSLKYMGVKNTDRNKFAKLRDCVCTSIKPVRSPRQLSLIFKDLQVLNNKFSSELPDNQKFIFPEELFICTVNCKSCKSRCKLSNGHINGGEKEHYNSAECIYNSEYDNKKYLCIDCLKKNKRTIVNFQTQINSDGYVRGMAKYVWQGSEIKCPVCRRDIFKSRRYWYGNPSSPEDIGVV